MINAQLTADMKDAMRAKDKPRLATIRMVIDRMQKKEKDAQRELSEEETISVIQTFKKQTEEEISGYQEAGNEARVEELKKSLEVITKYLPAQMGEEEVYALVVSIAKGLTETEREKGKEVNVIGKGDLMKTAMQQMKGKADNRTINQAVTKFYESNSK